MTEDQTDPTLGPDGTAAVDLNPERCSFTWTPGADTPLGRRGMDRVRCTARIDDVNHSHHWSSVAQDRWIDETLVTFREAIAPSATLTKPLEALPLPMRDLPPLEEEQRASEKPEPTEEQIAAGVAAFHAELTSQGMGWTSPEDWRDEVTAAIRAALSA
jgi:hypothetical protein